jgi:hypothetical protein
VPDDEATWPVLSGWFHSSKNCPRVWVVRVGDSLWMTPSCTSVCSQEQQFVAEANLPVAVCCTTGLTKPSGIGCGAAST